MLTPEQIAEIRTRADMATPGEWVEHLGSIEANVSPHPHGLGTVSDPICEMSFRGDPFDDDEDELACVDANAAFIAHARADVPALCDTVDALRADNERLRNVVDWYREMEKQDRCAEKLGAMDAYIDARRARDAAHHARLAGRRAMELLDGVAALDAGKEEG